jgi:hypothetical protein
LARQNIRREKDKKEVNLMRLAENESRLVGMKFKALVELSQERSDVGFEIPPYMRSLGFVFHKTVEMVVDNFVDNRCKCVIVAILHHIAQGLCN